jgi:type II secretory pathway pseudopilin PulG
VMGIPVAALAELTRSLAQALRRAQRRARLQGAPAVDGECDGDCENTTAPSRPILEVTRHSSSSAPSASVAGRSVSGLNTG